MLSATSTRDPSSENLRQIAEPIAPPPPVTSTDLPESPFTLVSPLR